LLISGAGRVPSPQNFVSPKLAYPALIGRNSTRIRQKKKKKKKKPNPNPNPGKTSRIGAGFCSLLRANKSYVCSLANNLNYKGVKLIIVIKMAENEKENERKEAQVLLK
jgi:hypothetical protein